MKGPRRKLFAYADLLADLLAPAPSVQIILSTSWVSRMGFFSAMVRLPRELRQRCVGSTYRPRMDKHRFGSLTRGQQIAVDLNLRQSSSWLAIDDDDRGFPGGMRSRLVHTDGSDGLAAPGPVMKLREQVAKLIELDSLVADCMGVDQMPAAPRSATPVR